MDKRESESELSKTIQRRLEFYEHFFIENLENTGVVWQTIVNYRNHKNVSNSYGQPFVQQQLPENPTADFVFDRLSSPTVRSILSICSLQDLVHILQVTDNKTLATVLSIDPQTVSVGSINWDKLIFDLWDDLININFNDLSTFLLLEQAIFSIENERIVRKFPLNSDRVAQLVCLLAQRYQDLDILEKALYFIGTVKPFYLTLANKCTKIDIDEFEWMLWHRDIFISLAEQLDKIATELKRRSFLTAVDLTRVERLKTDQAKAKYIFDTMQRKSVSVMSTLITVCHLSGNEDLAYLMKLKPIDIQIPWNAFQLIQLNWVELINKVNYEKIASYLVSSNFMKYKEHVQCKVMGSNQERMRLILKLVLTREEPFYDAFFHILSLQTGLKRLFQNCFPMSFEEKKILLECQDFLAQEIQHTDLVCDQLAAIGLLTTSDLEYINKMPSVLTQNLSICNVLKQKSSGTIIKMLNVLWKTKNRNCAEILAIDFQNFQMTIEEWNKLKTNWVELVKTVNADFVCPTLVNTGVISDEEHHWIEKSSKNRQKMRKLLRILPNKKRGYKILLLSLSQYDAYQDLLLKCQPMDLWQLKRLQANLEFLTDNTENLMGILQELVVRNILTENEAKLITYYQEPVQELYMLLMGKENGILDHLIEILELTENDDAATILKIDLFSIKMNSIEWVDYQRIWRDFLDEIKYTNVREYLIASGLISTMEDHACMVQESNDSRIRLLLQILPYKQGGFQTLVQLML